MIAFTTLNLMRSGSRDMEARTLIAELIQTLASHTQNGLMSKEDKIKLDGIEEEANNVLLDVQNNVLIINARGDESDE